MQRHKLLVILAVCAVATLAGTAFAKNVTISIPMEDVAVKSGERGDCYVVKFTLPADLAGKRLDSVFLDFVVDASPANPEAAETALLVGVFPLTEAATDAPLRYLSDVPSVRPISLGENRPVRADITDIVRGWLANPSTHHGLVVGALTGPEVGTVELQDAVLGSGVAFRVTFFYQNRSGERVSAK
jgi:hypothetical protein